ncbi:MAG TPA: PilC/PilY family type IV pilus protein [Myxococcota bacterium]|nr:PilC/PilY family type IV pilus protein [Myxococcota bacterium]
MASKRLVRILSLFAALALAREVRAQAGDLDILSRTVPPIVMLQFDTSGSMKNIILPDAYLTARGANYPTTITWWNKANDVTNFPASFLASSSTYYCGTTSGCTTTYATKLYTGSAEDFRPTCQIFAATADVNANKSVCVPQTNPTAAGCNNNGTNIPNDDQDDSNPQGGSATIKCWNMPLGCTNVPAGWTCSTTTRARKKTSTTTVSQPYTVITAPDVSFTSTTDYPPNYLWWIVQQIYLGHTPVPFIAEDRNGAGKDAITQLVNNVNIDGQPDRVKFGLSRYDSGSNGGYTVVVPDLNNKATLLSTLASLPASGGTPLSETLVDTARYLAGADKLGKYPQYNRSLTGATVAASSAPQSPVTSSCEKLFIVAITDGLPTSDNNDHYTHSAPNGGDSFAQTFPSPYTSDGSYLDDVAKKLYATDLRTTLSGNQNVITYTVGFTVASTILQNAATQGHGLYFQSNNANDLADSLTGAITDIIARNTTLTSATVPATRSAFGNGFYTAYFVPSGHKPVWPGHLEAYTLSADLQVLDDNNNPAIDPVTNLFFEPRHPHWDAANTMIQDYNSRTLYTTKGTTRIPFTDANLVDPNQVTASATNLTTVMLGLVDSDKDRYPQPRTDASITDPNDPNGAVSYKRLGSSIVNWVTGKDAFREDGNDPNAVRPFVFGDVFHSSPVVVGPPPGTMRFETGFGPVTDPNSFMGKFAHRERVLYVGANDGFLHGFRAGTFVDPSASVVGDEYYTPGTGHEVFGYVPGFLLPKLKLLPRDNIAKQYFVDGEPTAADAWIDYNSDNVKDPTDWTTVLLTPMREGGAGILALDVTDPNASSGNHGPYPRLMWEFTNASLGQTWSRPIVTRVRVKAAAGTGDHCGVGYDCIEQWVAIFAAGYTNEGNPNMGVYVSDPNSPSYAAGKGIFIVRLKDGSVLAQLKPTATGTLSNMKYAMAAEPSVLDLDEDGFADVIYEGDLGGQLWKWDISAVGVLTGGVVPTTVWPAGILFQAPVATVAAGVKHYHSIFTGAGAAIMKVKGQDVLTLTFASGERADLGYAGVAASDPNAITGQYDDNNRFWVVQDTTPTGAGAFPSNLPIYETASSPHDGLTDITYTDRDDNPDDKGYFFRIPNGEKFMTDMIIFEGVVLTLSYLPDAAGAGADGSCALGGDTLEYAWTLANGVGVLTGTNGSSGSGGSVTTVRSQPLGNGAPTNPRITVSKGSDGTVVMNSTAQTSMGEVQHLGGLPTVDPVKPVFWRQEF